jgi:hypothetical protein
MPVEGHSLQPFLVSLRLEVAGVSCDGLCCDPVPLPKIGLTEPDAEFIQRIVDVFNTLANNDLFHDKASLENFIKC